MPTSKSVNRFKFVLSLAFLIFFAYVIVYADKFFKVDEPTPVSSYFTQASVSEKNGLSMEGFGVNVTANAQGIITYTVQAGDNLSSIASQFGTTIGHIQKINNLSSGRPIRPGQELVITDEQDGFLYMLEEKTNAKIFADTYNLPLEDVMTLNYIQDETEILREGQELFLNIPLEKAYQVGLLERPKPKPKPAVTYRPTINRSSTSTTKTTNNTSNTTTTRTNTTSTITNATTDSSAGSKIISSWTFNEDISNRFYRGHCTRYAAIITPEIFPYIDENTQDRLFGGNGNQWYDNAAAAGFDVGQTPRAGAIIVYHNGYRWRSAGHVGKVISYYPSEGKMIIRDMNRKGKFIVTERWEDVDDPNIKGYIYPDGNNPRKSQ